MECSSLRVGGRRDLLDSHIGRCGVLAITASRPGSPGPVSGGKEY
jgi:hypothetical protein